MIKKRIFISTLILLFLFSTTGYPITYHLCKMMDSKSLNKCDACEAENNKNESACCSNENNDHQLSLNLEKLDCCQIEFVYNKLKDDYILTKIDETTFTSFDFIFQSIDFISIPNKIDSNKSFYTDSSPPFLINPDLHITNSIFLI